MTDLSPASPFAELDPGDYVLTFATVATRVRHDGWSPDRQRRFILMLRETATVSSAARAVGCSAQSAYKLRHHPNAAEFAAAWDRAMTEGRARAFELAFDRAVNGEEHPHYYRGQVVGTVRRVDNRLLIAALSYSKAIRPYRPGKQDE